MQSLKVSACEVVTALGLLGILDVCLALLHDPWLVKPSFVIGGLIALYAVTAVASEAVIVSIYRPPLGVLIALNVLVAAIVTQPRWSRVQMLKGFLWVGIATAILRVLVGAMTLEVSKQSLRRFASALLGIALLLTAAWNSFNMAEQAYYSYYVFARFKEGYIVPTRWHDFVALAVLWSGTVFLFYLSYRLLKYALRIHQALNRA